MENYLVDSLKRLSKVSTYSNKMTQKLRNSCDRISWEIAKSLPLENHRDSYISGYHRDSNVFGVVEVDPYLLDDITVTRRGYFSREDDLIMWGKNPAGYSDHINMSKASRRHLITFALDIKNGLLDRIADELQTRANKTEKVVAELETVNGYLPVNGCLP